VFAIDASGSMAGSRMNCLKSVLTQAIHDISKRHPNRKVGIVVFESFVQVIGDAS